MNLLPITTSIPKTADVNLKVNVGDTLLMGKFKNMRVVVKKIGKDDHGMPTVNKKKLVTFRYPKKDTTKKEAAVSGLLFNLSRADFRRINATNHQYRAEGEMVRKLTLAKNEA